MQALFGYMLYFGENTPGIAVHAVLAGGAVILVGAARLLNA